ncbi:hypothetical protein ACVI1J_001706 [Bradyrhizobium diazoefficiens]
MRLHANEQIAPGHVVIQQPGEVIVCRLADLRYEPGDDADTEMIVNPADVEVARAMWFEPKGQMR